MLSFLVIILSHKLTLSYDISDIMVSPVNFQIYEELLVRWYPGITAPSKWNRCPHCSWQLRHPSAFSVLTGRKLLTAAFEGQTPTGTRQFQSHEHNGVLFHFICVSRVNGLATHKLVYSVTKTDRKGCPQKFVGMHFVSTSTQKAWG